MKRVNPDDDNNDDGDDWAHYRTIDFLEKVYVVYGSKFGYNDISNINGGKFQKHREHQEGLDIDFIIRDGGEDFGDEKLSWNEFESIRKFIERGFDSSGNNSGYEPYIKRIIAPTNIWGLLC